MKKYKLKKMGTHIQSVKRIVLFHLKNANLHETLSVDDKKKLVLRLMKNNHIILELVDRAYEFKYEHQLLKT
jgi:hypothetical protein